MTTNDGKKYIFAVNPEMDCCVRCMWTTYSSGLTMQMTLEAKSETKSAGTKPMMGPFPFSPCPCTTCCGCGPLRGQWAFERDASNTAQWNAVGSVFAGGCCECATNHAGDTFYHDAEHLGTKEQPWVRRPPGPGCPCLPLHLYPPPPARALLGGFWGPLWTLC